MYWSLCQFFMYPVVMCISGKKSGVSLHGVQKLDMMKENLGVGGTVGSPPATTCQCVESAG